MTHISLDPNYIYCHCIRAICICTMSASFGVLADIVKKVQVALLFVNVLLILTHFDDRAAPVKKQAIYISWSKKAGTTMGNTFRSTLCFESLLKLHKKTGNRMYNRARWDWPRGPKIKLAGLFSSTFWFQHSFCCPWALLIFCPSRW